MISFDEIRAYAQRVTLGNDYQVTCLIHGQQFPFVWDGHRTAELGRLGRKVVAVAFLALRTRADAIDPASSLSFSETATTFTAFLYNSRLNQSRIYVPFEGSTMAYEVEGEYLAGQGVRQRGRRYYPEIFLGSVPRARCCRRNPFPFSFSVSLEELQEIGRIVQAKIDEQASRAAARGELELGPLRVISLDRGREMG